MISDRLYSLAFEYKKTKLWNSLWDTEIFALKMSDGNIGYITIMGADRSHQAVGLYLGDDGINNLRTIVEFNEFTESPFKTQENILRQECLQCVFANKDELTEKELEETKNYTRTHGIRLSGKKAFPQFIKYPSYRTPCYLQSPQDQEYLCEALSASIALAEILKKKKPYMIGIDAIHRESKEILMLEPENGQYLLKRMELPELPSEKYPVPDSINEINLAKLKRYQKFGTWECEIIRFPKPIQNEEEELPFYPIVLLAVEISSNYLLPMSPVAHYEENPEQLMDLFMDSLLEDNVRPQIMKVRDERTYLFAKPFCDRLKIPLSLEENLPSLEIIEDTLWNKLNQNEEEEIEEILSILDTILNLEDKYLSELPSFMTQQLQAILQRKEAPLPENIKEKLILILRKIEQAQQELPAEQKSVPKKKKSKVISMIPARSYVISISLGTGCYRHIQISGNSTLEELHLAIMEAFQLKDNHAHAFFMDNHSWSIHDCYYKEGLRDSSQSTSDYPLNQIGLYQGKPFKYIFDFKDNWIFQCKVLRILNNETDIPTIIRSKGSPPNQSEDSE